jgi:osmotically-inducible protein OsmY
MPNNGRKDREIGSESERHTGYWEDHTERDVQGFRGGGNAGAMMEGGHRGKGPGSYTRSDERIRDSVCEALTDDDHVDATHIEVVVQNGDVILTGVVDDRRQKRVAEDVAMRVGGVHDVQNNLRIDRGNRSATDAVGRNETDKKHRA